MEATGIYFEIFMEERAAEHKLRGEDEAARILLGLQRAVYRGVARYKQLTGGLLGKPDQAQPGTDPSPSVRKKSVRGSARKSKNLGG